VILDANDDGTDLHILNAGSVIILTDSGRCANHNWSYPSCHSPHNPCCGNAHLSMHPAAAAQPLLPSRYVYCPQLLLPRAGPRPPSVSFPAYCSTDSEQLPGYAGARRCVRRAELPRSGHPADSHRVRRHILRCHAPAARYVSVQRCAVRLCRCTVTAMLASSYLVQGSDAMILISMDMCSLCLHCL
jgi:hypothetical protein